MFDVDGWNIRVRRGIGEFYSQPADYQVALDVPAGFVVAATGKKVQEMTMTGRTTSRWHADQVRDFAWVADPRYEIAQTTSNGVALSYLYLPGHADAAEAGLASAAEALEFFGDEYGPYPYSTFTVVESSAIGSGRGIEYPQLVMISEDLHRNTKTSTSLEHVVVHEVAHQWWYGLVGNDEGTEAWLDEGFATHSTRRYMMAKHGTDPPIVLWPKVLDFLPAPSQTETAQFLYLNQARLGFDQPVRMDAWEYDDQQTYIVSTYYKGSIVLDLLEHIAGPEEFSEVMREYARRFSGGTATTDDFIGVAEEVTGRDLGDFFAQWLDGVGTLDYGVDDLVRSRTEDGRSRTVVDLVRRGSIVMPVDVEVTMADGSRVRRQWDGNGALDQIVFDTPAAVTSVELDPDHRLPDVNRVDNFYPRRWRRSFNPFSLPSDAYAVAHLPYVWYDDGWRIGLVVVSGYPPVVAFPAGMQRDVSLTGSVSRGLGSGDVRFSASLSSRLGVLGPRAFWEAAAGQRPGLRHGRARLRWFLGKHLYRTPYHGLTLTAGYEDWIANAGEDGRPDYPIDAGAVRELGVAYEYNSRRSDFFPRHGQRLEIGADAGLTGLGSDWSFVRTHAQLEAYQTVGRGRMAVNLSAGHVTGTAPAQRRVLLREDANFLASQFDSVHAQGLVGLTAEMRMEIIRGVFPLSVATTGNVARTWGSLRGLSRPLAAEAAVGLRIFDNAPYAIQVDLPVWTWGAGDDGFGAGRVVVRFGRPFQSRRRRP